MSNEAEITGAQRLRQAFETGTRDLHVIVVGDSMLDRYIWGSVDRISPEAPVPVIRKTTETALPGGAANVALNVAGLGARVSLVSIIGDDDEGRELAGILARSRIGTEYLHASPDLATTTKTRIITGHQHVLRIDEEPVAPPGDEVIEPLIELAARALAAKPDAIILSDYRKGVLTDAVCSAVIRGAGKRGIPVFVDPKGANYQRYTGANVITPNLKELELATGIDRNDVDGLIEAGRELIGTLDLDELVLTRGADGLTLIDEHNTLHSPARAQEVFDVTGAGDTVVASLTLARIMGLDWADTLHVANVAAGLVVQRRGAVPIELAELLKAIDPRANLTRRPVLTPYELEEIVGRWRANGERVVFTNGCFDILHAGHVSYLEAAAAEGDRLVVALNTDESVRALKGEDRPVMSEQERATIIASLKPVDAVTLFGDQTPLNLINQLRPDVLVKGADYAGKEIVGAREVESWGGRVVLATYVDGLSTSSLIERLRK